MAAVEQLAAFTTESDTRRDHLAIPAEQCHRRASVESVFTEFSEFSILSNEHHMHGLTRLDGNLSDTSVYSSHSTNSGSSIRQKLWNFYDQNYGALLVLISQFFGSMMNICTSLLEHEGAHGSAMHPFQILFVRQSLTAVLCTIYAVTTKSIPHFPFGPPDRQVRFLLIARGLTGFFGIFGMYFSLLYLPLSEATVLTFLAPILTCYLCSYIMPGETFSRQQQIAGFVSLVGVVFIAQPLSLVNSFRASPSISTGAGVGLSQPSAGTNNSLPSPDGHHTVASAASTPSQHLLAIGIAMIGVLGATGAYTTIRAIGTRAHAFVPINYFSVWCSFVSLMALLLIPSVSFRLPANITEWGLLLTLGTCGFVMQGLLTMGLAYKSTGKGGGSGQPKVDHHKSTIAHLDPSTKNVNGRDIELQTHTVTDVASSSAAVGTVDTRPRRSRSRAQNKSCSSGTRATSMVYTQMLFALAADKLVFGITPGLWSWLGSGLILAGAIWVASARDNPVSSSKVSHREQAQSGHGDHENRESAKLPEESVGLLRQEVDDGFDMNSTAR